MNALLLPRIDNNPKQIVMIILQNIVFAYENGVPIVCNPSLRPSPTSDHFAAAAAIVSSYHHHFELRVVFVRPDDIIGRDIQELSDRDYRALVTEA